MTSNASARKARVAAEKEFKRSEAEADQAAQYRPAVIIPAGTRRGYEDGYTRYGRPGQCQACGAWRADANPPTVHRAGCVEGPDGSRVPAVYDPAPIAKLRATTVKEPLTVPGRGARHRR